MSLLAEVVVIGPAVKPMTVWDALWNYYCQHWIFLSLVGISLLISALGFMKRLWDRR